MISTKLGWRKKLLSFIGVYHNDVNLVTISHQIALIV